MTKILVSAAAAIAFGSWSSASANVLTVTDIGTVVGGYDGLGLFGTAGADLIGDSKVHDVGIRLVTAKSWRNRWGTPVARTCR